MATKKLKGLGRGLDALLGGDMQEAPAPGRRPSTLPVSSCRPVNTSRAPAWTTVRWPSWPPRSRPRASCSRCWCVRRGRERRVGYEIIAGERRFRAAQLAGLDEIPVLVREVDDQNAAAMALIENIQREDLNPLEEAQGIARLISEFDFTHEQAANAVGRSRSAVSNLLRLVNLAQPVQTMLMAGDIDMGHARALLAVDAASQIALANQVIAKRLSVRETEKLVARALEEQEAPPAARARRKSRATSCAWKKSCRTSWPRRSCSRWAKGRGQMIIDFADLDILDSVLARGLHGSLMRPVWWARVHPTS
jgi:ParB family chromosome partitioning protein